MMMDVDSGVKPPTDDTSKQNRDVPSTGDGSTRQTLSSLIRPLSID